MKSLWTVVDNVKWCSHDRQLLEDQKSNYGIIQQSLFQVYTQRTGIRDLKRSICTFMYIAALLTIRKMWKQPKGPLTEEWKNKMCQYIQ